MTATKEQRAKQLKEFATELYKNGQLGPAYGYLDDLHQCQTDEIVSLKAMQTDQRKLFSRCLEVLSTLEGECDTESEMLNALTSDVKTTMGITPLIAG
jgi:hypothetical protein